MGEPWGCPLRCIDEYFEVGKPLTVMFIPGVLIGGRRGIPDAYHDACDAVQLRENFSRDQPKRW